MSDTEWDPVNYNKVANFVPLLGEPLISLLDPKSTDRILDLGCGDGSLTEKILPQCAQLIGVDASSKMVAAAKERGINAHVIDAHQLRFHCEFDKVISNAALHWMGSPELVIKGVHKALKKNGTFVAEFGGKNNADMIVNAIITELNDRGISFQNPWYFPTAEEYASLLVKHGFEVESITLFDRLTPLPGHINDWIETFGQVFFKGLTKEQTRAVVFDISTRLESQLFIDHQWHVDYVRLRVQARKI